MSVELDIAPTRPFTLTWRELALAWRKELGPRAEALLGAAPELRRLAGAAAIDADEVLDPSGDYVFALAAPGTLALSLSPTQGMLDEHSYLDDYARNLTPPQVQALADAWARVGSYLEITTHAGRAPHERELFLALACALATRCDGSILVMNDGILDVGVGAYTADEFRHVRWPR